MHIIHSSANIMYPTTNIYIKCIQDVGQSLKTLVSQRDLCTCEEEKPMTNAVNCLRYYTIMWVLLCEES